MGTGGQREREDPVQSVFGAGGGACVTSTGFLLHLNCVYLSNSHRCTDPAKREAPSAEREPLGFLTTG